MLRIRQIVFAARELESTVDAFRSALGLQVVYRDPLVAEFGLHNALMQLGDQFIEVVSPTREGTAAGRHLARHGDSAYMLILQTDDLPRDRARVSELGVRVVWQASYPDIQAIHLHPKDVGGAIVSLDQPAPPESWRWAGPSWQAQTAPRGAITGCSIGTPDAVALTSRWSGILGTAAKSGTEIPLDGATLCFESAPSDLIRAYSVTLAGQAPRREVVCGTRFEIT
jgi:hypothetical protein